LWIKDRNQGIANLHAMTTTPLRLMAISLNIKT